MNCCSTKTHRLRMPAVTDTSNSTAAKRDYEYWLNTFRRKERKVHKVNAVLAGAVFACWTITGFAQEPKMFAQIPNTDRSISYHLHDIPAIHVGVRYVTVLALPVGEKIAGVFVGDHENWAVEHAGSIVTIKAGGIG